MYKGVNQDTNTDIIIRPQPRAIPIQRRIPGIQCVQGDSIRCRDGLAAVPALNIIEFFAGAYHPGLGGGWDCDSF